VLFNELVAKSTERRW